MLVYRLSEDAEEELVGLLGWSEFHFGEDAAVRYETLVSRAIRDLAEDPVRPGSKLRPDLGPELYVYHLSHSRKRAETPTGIVQRPRHFIVYRFDAETLFIVRILHDAMDLPEHLP